MKEVSLAEVDARLKRDPEYAEAERRLRPYLDLGTSILLARVARGWTQTELAQRAGLTQDKISRIEGATGNPRLETLQKIADALGLALVIAPRRDVQTAHSN